METTKAVLGTIKVGRKVINIFAGDKVKTLANGKSYLFNTENTDGLAISKAAREIFFQCCYTEQYNSLENKVIVAICSNNADFKVELKKTYNEVSLDRKIDAIANFFKNNNIFSVDIDLIAGYAKSEISDKHLMFVIDYFFFMMTEDLSVIERNELREKFDFETCYETLQIELSKEVVTPAVGIAKVENTQAPAVESLQQCLNNFKSSDDCLADGVKAIMQQPTKVVSKETIALRLLHFFNAHAKQYHCLAIDSLQGEKEFIDGCCQTKTVAFLAGLNHFVSKEMFMAMQSFSEQEFENPIYLSENKTVFEQKALVIDKYGNSFEVSKNENGYYLRISETDHETVLQTYKAEDLRLVCQYEYDCFFQIEPEMVVEINPNTDNYYQLNFDNWQFDKTYHDFWIYKLQGLSGEEKEYIILEVAELDKEFAKFLCEKVLPKIPDYKELYDFLELAF
jgi:hypothetical protein